MNRLAKAFESKSDQINADDLVGGPIIVTVQKVTIDLTKPTQRVDVYLDGHDRVFRPCKTVGKILMTVWGDDGKWIGQSMKLFREPTVKYGAAEVGGIRVSHVTGIKEPRRITVLETRTSRKLHTIQPLEMPSNALQTPFKPTAPANALDLAKAAATGGTAAFRAWWGSDEGKACRDAALANIDALKQIAADADVPPDDDDAPPM